MKRKMLIPILATLAIAAAPRLRAADMPAGFRGEFLTQLADVEGKIEGLAQAVPDAKYTWRPAEGVRSISEVYMHIAGSNYFLLTFAGVPWPAGVPKDLEKTTDKAKVMEALKASFENLRQVVLKTSDADLEKPTKMFGHDTTYRGVIFTIANHLHEHLGQSIAYARMNGVVPPWSMPKEK
jgi:uncharacterized damage-inducible protein DinB